MRGTPSLRLPRAKITRMTSRSRRCAFACASSLIGKQSHVGHVTGTGQGFARKRIGNFCDHAPVTPLTVAVTAISGRTIRSKAAMLGATDRQQIECFPERRPLICSAELCPSIVSRRAPLLIRFERFRNSPWIRSITAALPSKHATTCHPLPASATPERCRQTYSTASTPRAAPRNFGIEKLEVRERQGQT